jgi:hypothetical protein
MSNTYFANFKLDTVNQVLVFGDRYKISLLRQLADESVKMGYHAIITSLVPEPYPVEGKVLVADDILLLNNLIKDDQPEIIYLAKTVKNDMLQPFDFAAINKLAKQLNEKIKLFVLIESEQIKTKSGLKVYKSARLICSLNYNLLKENLPQINELKELKRKSSGEQVSGQVYKLIYSYCSGFIEAESSSDKVCYIGQVKGMFDENVIIPVVRNLKAQINSRMLIGDINSYHLKEV